MIRSEVIVVLNNLRNYYSNRQGGEENAQALDFAISSLLTDEAYQLEQEPRWIPVGERLPEFEYGESDSVLVCFENETQDVLYFNGSNWCFPTGEIYISVNHKNGWHNNVIAWMPLPTPYEPQESEG